VTQAITKAAATASQVKPGGNITYTQKHSKAVSMRAVTSAFIISQNTVGSFLQKVTSYIHIYTTTFSGHFYLYKYYIFYDQSIL